MFRIEVHQNIRQIVSFFYFCGFWHRGDEETVRERRLKLFYSFYFGIFPLSLVAGSVATDNPNETIFSVEVLIISFVLQLKLWYVLWNKDEILELLDRVCVHFVDDRETFDGVNQKLKVFMKFVRVFLSTSYVCGAYTFFVAPLIERNFFINIKFPSNWNNSESAFWIKFFFTFSQATLSATLVLFSVIAWYLMANCCWKYEVLGDQLAKTGEMRTSITVKGSTDQQQLTDSEKDFLYRRDLTEAVNSHNQLRGMTSELNAFLSKLFVFQLATGGLCICGSTYSIVFFRGENLLELLVYITVLLYCVFDIFVIMYLGNEIMLASDRLSHRLYESSWVDRSESIKMKVLIFGELLMQPQQLTVLQLYPLTLSTFARILHSAYSMFNILQNFK